MIRRLNNALPLSHAMVEAIVEGHVGAPFDFERTFVLIPGATLAHGIERQLLQRAQEANLPLAAPSIVTAKMFAARFVQPHREQLSDLATLVAWRETVSDFLAKNSDARGALRSLLAPSTDKITSSEMDALTRRLARLMRDAASACQSFAQIAAQLEAPKSTENAAIAGEFSRRELQWRTLAQLETAWLDRIAAAQCIDRDVCARDAVVAALAATGEDSSALTAPRIFRGGAERVVVLLADPEPVHRLLLARLRELGCEVDVCVHANEEIDGEGFPLPKVWSERAFTTDLLPSGSIHVASSPLDVGQRVISEIESLKHTRATAGVEATVRSDELVVMAPNEDMRRGVEGALIARGISVVQRDKRAFLATRLGSLLARIAELLSENSCSALANFVRHPDVDTALQDKGISDADCIVTRYRAEAMPTDWRDAAVGEKHLKNGFATVQSAVKELLALLQQSRAAHEWARPIRETLSGIVGDNRLGATASERVRSVRALDRALADLANTPKQFTSKMDASDALRLLVAQLESTEVRLESTDEGLGIIGWLDAGLADEPHIILAGFNDGLIPEGTVQDTILPDDLRVKLGMISSQRRAARDAWILDGIIARTKLRRVALGSVHSASLSFIVARHSAAGDPMRPSRFLLRVARDELAPRVVKLFTEVKESPSLASNNAQSEADQLARAKFPIKPAISGSVWSGISVTTFKTYLECPYLFQLKCDSRLGLNVVDEHAQELSPGGFGNLVHGVLEQWGREEARQLRPTTDANEISQSLSRILDRHVAEKFAKNPPSAVHVQIELARRRLNRVAVRQAKEATDGWKVRFIEIKFDERPSKETPGNEDVSPKFMPPLFPDENGLFLRGRIDRVDQNQHTGKWRTLDYKTSAKGKSPTATHRAGRGKNKKWIDLQLPLYRELLKSLRLSDLAGLGSSGEINVESDHLGYVILAPHEAQSKFEFLKCTDDEMASARTRAEEVVAAVIAGEFTPAPGVPVRSDDPLAQIWGVGLRGLDESDDGFGDGASDNRGGDE
ncbi:MAG: PD-(D/E)XK nuclease family protein [Planctomycetota bacterium]|nr:MAG: PD-(D/E)XK nuclease family protein [Planctomycetota bacterium]